VGGRRLVNAGSSVERLKLAMYCLAIYFNIYVCVFIFLICIFKLGLSE
jgi:hypothetical protein